jgi:ABC-type dipeptide/oligopeptide/nickel transport system permease component
MGLTTLSALLSLGGILAADLLYAWADPRVTYRRRSTA